jgi:hypothetical protein
VITQGRSLGRSCAAIVAGSDGAGGVTPTKLTDCRRQVLVLKAQEVNPSKDLRTKSWPYEVSFSGFIQPVDLEKFH